MKTQTKNGILCLLPIGAWFIVIILRVLVEAPIENELATWQLIGGPDLINSLRSESQNRLGPPSATQLARRGSTFAVYGTLASVYIVFSVGVAATGSIIAARRMGECRCSPWQKALPIVGSAVALSVFIALAHRSHATDFVLTWKDFGELLRSLDTAGPLRFWVSLTKTATSFGFVASFALLMLSCVVLLPSHNDSALAIEYHRRRMETLDLVLILGTSLFVFALIRDRAFFNFADSLISKTAEDFSATAPKSAVMHLAAGIITVNGIYLSILTAAVYLPSAFILNARTDLFVPARIRSLRFRDRKEWLSKHGLDRTLKDQFWRAATVLVPAVTGGASGLLEALH